MVKIQVEVFQVVTPCSVVAGYKRFRGPSYLQFHTTQCHNTEDLDLNT